MKKLPIVAGYSVVKLKEDLQMIGFQINSVLMTYRSTHWRKNIFFAHVLQQLGLIKKPNTFRIIRLVS